MACDVFYIIGKFLELKCLKWACIVHWTFETQVMAKRGAGNQTGNLTFDQKKLRIYPIYLSTNNVRHTIGKLSTRATTLLQTASPRSVHKVMGLQSRKSLNLGDFETPTWESRDKKPFVCGPRGEV